MPTGYTADVGTGEVTDFPTFAMRCARNFGALIEMRDEPMDAEVPEEFRPSPYHAEERVRAETRLSELKAMTDAEKDEAGRDAYVEAESNWSLRRAKRDLMRGRYTAMLSEVRAWEPPTPEHRNLKTFMVEQLELSIECDCSGSYDSQPDPADYAPDAWWSKQVASARRNVSYHTEEAQKEAERARERTDWLRQLRASLAEPVPA